MNDPRWTSKGEPKNDYSFDAECNTHGKVIANAHAYELKCPKQEYYFNNDPCKVTIVEENPN